jgi:hypothetical protein
MQLPATLMVKNCAAWRVYILKSEPHKQCNNLSILFNLSCFHQENYKNAIEHDI